MKLFLALFSMLVISLAGLSWVFSEPQNIMQQIYFAVKCSTTMIWMYTIHSISVRYTNSKGK